MPFNLRSSADALIESAAERTAEGYFHAMATKAQTGRRKPGALFATSPSHRAGAQGLMIKFERVCLRDLLGDVHRCQGFC